MLALLIVILMSVIGVLESLGLQRPLAFPVALLLGAIAGYWVLRPMLWLTIMLIVIAAIGIWSPVVPSLATRFVRNDRVNLDSVDAVFVFSAGVTTQGLLRSEALDRLLTGIEVRSRRPALPLLVSVMRSGDRQRPVSSVKDQRALIAMVPASGETEWIDSVSSTRDEAVRLTRRAFQLRWRRVLLVTSPMHSRRACATVEALGLAVTCMVAPWRVAGWPPRSAGDRMVVMQRVVYEMLAWAQYRISGWADWDGAPSAGNHPSA